MTDNEWFNRAEGINAISVVLITAVIVVFVVTAIILGYYCFYKRRINKALKTDGSVKAPSITPGGTAVTTLVIVWVATTVIMFLLLTSISIHVKNTDMRSMATFDQIDSLYSNQNYYIQTLANISYNESLQNITNDYTMEFGKYNSKDNTVAVNVKVLPRLTMGKKDKLTFAIGDSISELKRGDDMYYYGEAYIPTYAVETVGILKLETNGTVLTQLISDDELEQLNGEYGYECINYYPYIDAGYSKETNENGEEVYTFEYVAYPAYEDNTKKFTELSVEISAGDKVIRTVDLMNDPDVQKGGDRYIFQYICKENDEKDLTMVIKGKDVLGYTYSIDSWYLGGDTPVDEGKDRLAGEEVFYIYDPEGRLVIHSHENPANNVW